VPPKTLPTPPSQLEKTILFIARADIKTWCLKIFLHFQALLYFILARINEKNLLPEKKKKM
jgi:hypothetical protein